MCNSLITTGIQLGLRLWSAVILTALISLPACSRSSYHPYHPTAESIGRVPFSEFRFSPALLLDAENVDDRLSSSDEAEVALTYQVSSNNEKSTMFIFVRQRLTSTPRYVLVRSRPLAKRPPRPMPMIVVPAALVAGADGSHNNATEWYPISRMQLNQTDPVLTTSLGWPLVACSRIGSAIASCGFAILFHGAEVEGHFSPRNSTVPNQEEVWNIVSAIQMRLEADVVMKR